VNFAQANNNNYSGCQVLKIASSRPGERILSIWQWGIVGQQSYRWFSENRTNKKADPGTNFWN
jgi:hypothetical protein